MYFIINLLDFLNSIFYHVRTYRSFGTAPSHADQRTTCHEEAQPIGTCAEARVSVAQCDWSLKNGRVRAGSAEDYAVTAVYNGEKYLEATMRSIVNPGVPKPGVHRGTTARPTDSGDHPGSTRGM